jgi:hypothetical protein
MEVEQFGPVAELVMPTPEPNGFVITLNNMGYMTSSLDRFSQDFADFSVRAPGPALDIGAAYGIATVAALARGARVIANDIDGRHLEILSRGVPTELRHNLSLKTGDFPDALDFTPGSLGAVLVCRVMHFFDGPTIERSAEKLFGWLTPGGKVFVIAETPYLRNFSSFIPTYEARKQAGDPWPGFVDDVKKIAPERGKSLPPKMHFLDPEVLARAFSKVGFVIEKASTFARPEFPEDIQLDGRESVGLVARKP